MGPSSMSMGRFPRLGTVPKVQDSDEDSDDGAVEVFERPKVLTEAAARRSRALGGSSDGTRIASTSNDPDSTSASASVAPTGVTAFRTGDDESSTSESDGQEAASFSAKWASRAQPRRKGGAGASSDEST